MNVEANDRKAVFESLCRQLAEARENLRLIQERKSEYVMATSVPLDLIKEERRTKERIEELEQRVEKQEQFSSAPSHSRTSAPSPAHTTHIGSVTGPVHTGTGDIRIEHYRTPSAPSRTAPASDRSVAVSGDEEEGVAPGEEKKRPRVRR